MLLAAFILFIGLSILILRLPKSYKNRKLRGWSILICFGIIVYGVDYGLSQSNKVKNPPIQIQDTKTARTNKTVVVKPPSIFNVGDTFKIDNFKYTLNNITDSIIVNDSINCIKLNLTVENVGKEASHLKRSMFKLKMTDGTIYTSSDTLDDGSLFSASIIPYVPTIGTISFLAPYQSTEMNYVLEIQGMSESSEIVDIKLY